MWAAMIKVMTKLMEKNWRGISMRTESGVLSMNSITSLSAWSTISAYWKDTTSSTWTEWRSWLGGYSVRTKAWFSLNAAEYREITCDESRALEIGGHTIWFWWNSDISQLPDLVRLMEKTDWTICQRWWKIRNPVLERGARGNWAGIQIGIVIDKFLPKLPQTGTYLPRRCKAGSKRCTPIWSWCRAIPHRILRGNHDRN